MLRSGFAWPIALCVFLFVLSRLQSPTAFCDSKQPKDLKAKDCLPCPENWVCADGKRVCLLGMQWFNGVCSLKDLRLHKKALKNVFLDYFEHRKRLSYCYGMDLINSTAAYHPPDEILDPGVYASNMMHMLAIQVAGELMKEGLIECEDLMCAYAGVPNGIFCLARDVMSGNYAIFEGVVRMAVDSHSRVVVLWELLIVLAILWKMNKLVTYEVAVVYYTNLSLAVVREFKTISESDLWDYISICHKANTNMREGIMNRLETSDGVRVSVGPNSRTMLTYDEYQTITV